MFRDFEEKIVKIFPMFLAVPIVALFYLTIFIISTTILALWCLVLPFKIWQYMIRYQEVVSSQQIVVHMLIMYCVWAFIHWFLYMIYQRLKVYK